MGNEGVVLDRKYGDQIDLPQLDEVVVGYDSGSVELIAVRTLPSSRQLGHRLSL